MKGPARVCPGVGAGAGVGVGLTGRGVGTGLGTELPTGRTGLGTEGGAAVGFGGAERAPAAVPTARTAADFWRATRREVDFCELMMKGSPVMFFEAQSAEALKRKGTGVKKRTESQQGEKHAEIGARHH